jgi:hypothetical protein
VYSITGVQDPLQHAVGQEVAICQQQVAGPQPRQQVTQQGLLPRRQRRQRRPEHRPRAAFTHAHHPDLRERARPVLVSGVAELGGVLRGVRQVQAHPVGRDQPHPGNEGRLLLLAGQRPGGRRQQGLHHLPAQPLPCQRDRRRGRLHP